MRRSNWTNYTPRPTAQEPKAPAPKAPLRFEASIYSPFPARVTLPSNLPEALKHLDNTQLQTLLHDVAVEIKRRGQTAPTKTAAPIPSAEVVSLGKPPATRSRASGEHNEVPEGKANLIRASFKAGVKPSTIARTFCISKSVVNRVLGAPEQPKR